MHFDYSKPLPSLSTLYQKLRAVVMLVEVLEHRVSRDWTKKNALGED